MSPQLEVNNLSVRYENEIALQNISFEVRAGEKMAIIGPNGAGKSTLLKTLMGLLKASSGTIRLSDGNRLGYVPQYDDVDWSFPVTVQDAVMMGLTRRIGWFRLPQKSHWERVKQALSRMELLDFKDRQIGELSGGQRRRVFIARSLVQDATVVLLDEPFAGVDIGAQTGLMQVLEKLNQDGISFILSTHDLNLAFQHFDTVMALRKEIIACGTVEEVYSPEVLSRLYGGKLATRDDGQKILIIVDDHHC